MREILLVGNPNVGKSTLFNSFTKSSVHTGNFHGVTTDSFSQKVNMGNEEVKITDLPGIYSLSGASNEEKLTRDRILKAKKDIIVIADYFSLRRSMYICMQLDELGIGYTLLINDKGKKRVNINTSFVQSKLGHNVYFINAQKAKLDSKYASNNVETSSLNYLQNYIKNLNGKNIDTYEAICALNGVENGVYDDNEEYIASAYEDLVKVRYKRIDEILDGAYYLGGKIAGHSKLDKFLTHPLLMPIMFFAFYVLSVYCMFFLLGPWVSDGLIGVLEQVVFEPISTFVAIQFDSVWLVEFLDQAVFTSIGTIITFLPQVFLLFVFLTILEDSGIITRLSYVLDDFLSRFGLNGKAVYTLLLGFGCNTMSSLASKNLNEENMRAKSLIISPYISCMARLPIFILIASCFFGARSFLIISGLYLLGLIVALIMSAILNKTFLPSKSGDLILEFPPLVLPNLKHAFKSGANNILEFVYRIFTVVLSVGIVVYVLTHLSIGLRYTNEITQSILYIMADKLSFILAPIGLNNAGIITCLFVGVLAKELIISTMAIINSSGAVGLGASITNSGSLIHFTPASAVSMLVFSLLYSSCASNYSIMKKQKGMVLFSIISQLVVAYMIAFVVYQSMTRGALWAGGVSLVIFLITFAIVYFIFKVIRKNNCSFCNKCNRKNY